MSMFYSGAVLLVLSVLICASTSSDTLVGLLSCSNTSNSGSGVVTIDPLTGNMKYVIQFGEEFSFAFLGAAATDVVQGNYYVPFMFGKVIGVNINTGKLVLNITSKDLYFHLAFDQKKRTLIGLGYHDEGDLSIASAFYIDPTSGKETRIGVFPGSNLPTEGGAVYDSINGIVYWTGVSKDKKVTIMGMDVNSGKVVSTADQSTFDGVIFWRVDFDPKRGRLVSITSNNTEPQSNLFITIYDMQSGKGVPIGQNHFGSYPDFVPTSSALFLKSRKLYYNSNDLNNIQNEKLYTVDLETGAQLAVLDLKDGNWYCDLSNMAPAS